MFWDRIVSIEPQGIQDTYDLTVEGDHNFVADGIVVHNSHSAAYALLAYQCAYLKGNYPAEFMAATLTSEMNDSARIVTLIEETKRLGLAILPPDVSRSAWRFTLEDGKIRYGLGAVRNVGQAAVESLVQARESGPFESLFDLARRLEGKGMNRRVLESLVAAGACDGLGEERGRLFAAVGPALERAASLQRERESGQSSLFGEVGGATSVAVVAPPLPDVPEWPLRERSQREKEVLGFYFSEHPLTPFRDVLARISTHTVADCMGLEEGADVRLGALVAEVKKINTRSGKTMAIATLEDLTGRVECTVFPEAYEAAKALLVPDQAVVVTGRIEVREERHRLLLSEVRGFDEAQRRLSPLPAHGAQGGGSLGGVSCRHRRVALGVPGRGRGIPSHRAAGPLPNGDAVPPLPGGGGRRRDREPQGTPPGAQGALGKGRPVTTWLDFEKPVLEMERKIQELRDHAAAQGLDAGDELEDLEKKADALRREIYANLTAIQRVQLARHPKRPYTLDYIERCFTDWTELHGDRHFADDPAIVAGPAFLEGRPVMVIGQQKGRDTKENLLRRFGMPNPEGYRKALRLMRTAERFHMPVVTLVDTPGAYPGLGAEERGQAEAIAVNLREMARLEIPIVTVVIGEGGSGGALAIAVADVVLMFENSIYSVISPEGCASILWRDGKKSALAAEALKLTAIDLERLQVVDGSLPEPLGGAHRDPAAAAETLRNALRRHLDALSGVSGRDLVERRLQKYRRMGVFQEGSFLTLVKSGC